MCSLQGKNLYATLVLAVFELAFLAPGWSPFSQAANETGAAGDSSIGNVRPSMCRNAALHEASIR
jgi:hypothetical protein